MNLPPGKAGLVVATIRVDGLVHGPDGMIAVVSNPQGRTYFLHTGDKLYDGSVEQITLEEVSFHESGAGCIRQARRTRSDEETVSKFRRTAMKTYWSAQAGRPIIRIACLLLVSSAAIATLWAGARDRARSDRTTAIASVEVGRAGQRTTVRVAGTGPLSYHVLRLSDPPRLVVDFSNARLTMHDNAVDKLVRSGARRTAGTSRSKSSSRRDRSGARGSIQHPEWRLELHGQF